MRKEINIGRVLLILLVIDFHLYPTYQSTFLSLLRMPFYFMVSGMLYSQKPLGSYFQKKSIQLLLPYFAFLVVINSGVILSFFSDLLTGQYGNHKEVYGSILFKLLYGGAALMDFDNPTSLPLWFLTSLFFTQQAYNLLNHFCKKPYALHLSVAAIYLFSCLIYFYGGAECRLRTLELGIRQPPMSIGTLLLTLPLYHLGYLFLDKWISSKKAFLLALLCCAATYYIHREITDLSIDMYQTMNGVPLLSLIACCSLTIVSIKLYQLIEKIPLLGEKLHFLGSSVITIFCLHGVIILSLKYYFDPNRWIIFFMCLIIPMLLHYLLLEKFSLTRLLFLGKHPKFAS